MSFFLICVCACSICSARCNTPLFHSIYPTIITYLFCNRTYPSRESSHREKKNPQNPYFLYGPINSVEFPFAFIFFLLLFLHIFSLRCASSNFSTFISLFSFKSPILIYNIPIGKSFRNIIFGNIM